MKTMGCQACGMFVEVEGANFESRFVEVLPLIQQQMDPGRFSTKDDDGKEEAEEEEDEENKVKVVEEESPEVVEQRDLHLLALLNLTGKMMREVNLVQNTQFLDDVDAIWQHLLQHQLYPHHQVRLAACQLAGHFFSAWDPKDVAENHTTDFVVNGDEVAAAKTPPKDRFSVGQTGSGKDDNPLRQSYFIVNRLSLVQTFGKAFVGQLQTANLEDVLATQVVKNLLYLARLAEALGQTEELVWLAKRLVREVNYEVIKSLGVTVKRSYVFKWVAAVAVTLNKDFVAAILPIVLPVLQRELTFEGLEEGFKTLVTEVVGLLKKQVGAEVFTAAYASAHQMRVTKKDVRKRQLAAEKVTDPDIAARKKIRLNLKKREAKKRKIQNKKDPRKAKFPKHKLSLYLNPKDG